jgi:hypothetical protein
VKQKIALTDKKLRTQINEKMNDTGSADEKKNTVRPLFLKNINRQYIYARQKTKKLYLFFNVIMQVSGNCQALSEQTSVAVLYLRSPSKFLGVHNFPTIFDLLKSLYN